MKRILVVVDMQNDFVDGALGTPEAASIAPNVAEEIRSFDGDEIFVTYDTHCENYMETLEGKKLPIPHCIKGSFGHEINAEVSKALEGKVFRKVFKPGFGTFEIVEQLKELYPDEEPEFEFIGLCTDVCVVTNALIARAGYPNAVIKVRANCCAGVTPENHEAALHTMRCCQIDVID